MRRHEIDRRLVLAMATGLSSFALSPSARAGQQAGWRLMSQGGGFGQAELRFTGRADADSVNLVQRSGAIRIENDTAFGPGWTVAIEWAADGRGGSGRFLGGPLRGRFRLEPDVIETRNYSALAEACLERVESHLFQPTLTGHDGWLRYRQALSLAAETAQDDWDFLAESQAAQVTVPFSHYRLFRPMATFQQMVQSLDGRSDGPPPVVYEADGDIGVMTVRSVQGQGVTDLVLGAWDEILSSSARALVIDLRDNPGGSFAVLDIAAPLLAAPVDGGVFLSAEWWRRHGRRPTVDEVEALPVFQSRDIMEWFSVLETEGVTRTRFEPAARRFDGPVCLLTSAATASAAEMLAEVLSRAGAATLVGEQTAGQMLSSRMFELPEGFGVFAPVADYFTAGGERIEGAGVDSHIECPAGEALERASHHLHRLINQGDSI